MMTRLRPMLAGAALVATALLLGVGPARAAIYTGSWDPLYETSPFQSLGWGAEAVFNVPDACLAQPDATYGVGTGACAGFGFLSASLSFYNALDPTRTVLETIAIADVANVVVSGVSISHGTVAGIGTGYFAAVVPSASGAAASVDGAGLYSFSLILLGSEQAQLIYANPINASPGCADNFVRGTECGKSRNTATGVFQVAGIPEPRTVTMMLMGLGAVALAGARRRRVPKRTG